MSDEKPNALYRAVWRLHFYAGIVVAPFAIFLAITGAIYVWKPQFEAARYAKLLTVAPGNASLPLDEQFAAARATKPLARAVTFTPAFAADRSSETVFALPDDDSVSVFVDPYTGRVLGERRESARFMTTIHDLHGTLLAGRAGEIVVELVASWALVLFLTGLYLWWPRPVFSVWGFLLPRLRARGRVFWRDLHAVPAVWLSVVTIFLLSTGLLWTRGAGTWYRTISAAAGEGTPRESGAGAHRSELTGWSPPLAAGVAEKIDALASTTPAIDAVDASDPHAAHRRAAAMAEMENQESKFENLRISLARVAAIARERGVPQPWSIAFPVGERGVFSVISDRNRAFSRAYLHLDQYSAAVLADVRYPQFGALAKFGLWSIIAHEGQLFGLANQILSTLAAAGVLLLSVSGLTMWWQRRPAGKLAAPTSEARLPRTVVLGTLALACLLPLLAASLAAIWIGERTIGAFAMRRTRTASNMS